MNYGNLTIKRIEIDELGSVTAVEFGDGAFVKNVAEFMADFNISRNFRVKSPQFNINPSVSVLDAEKAIREGLDDIAR